MWTDMSPSPTDTGSWTVPDTHGPSARTGRIAKLPGRLERGQAGERYRKHPEGQMLQRDLTSRLWWEQGPCWGSLPKPGIIGVWIGVESN